MVDRVTRTVQQGFFSRLANSVMGILVGILLIPGSVFLLSWNEYRTIHRTRGLTEAEQVVAEVPDAFEIDPQLNEHLVHVIGKATTEQTLTDPNFGIALKVLRLERQVEMYQWIEHKESRTRDKLGGGRETITTYTYKRAWHDGRINSDAFEERSGHENPPLHLGSHSQVTDTATLGSFRLSASVIESKMNSWTDVSLDEAVLLATMDENAKRNYKLSGNQLYYSAIVPKANEPQLGDLMIRFRKVEPTTVSVLAKQTPAALVAYKTSNGETIEQLLNGDVSAVDMFQSLKRENSLLAWLLRVVGWVLACVGFSLLTGPLKAVANFIPALGFLVGSVTFVVAVLLGSLLTLISIAVAWIAVRPVFGIALLLIAAGVIYLSSRLSKSAQARAAGNFGPPPVPPPLPQG